MIIWTVISSLISSVVYRLGGIGNPFPSKIRDWGCTLISLIWCVKFLPQVDWWWYLLSFILSWLALTTYHDWTGTDNFYLHGFFIGLALLPITYHLWVLCLIRAVVLGLAMGLWCKVFKNDIVEECGRGAFIIITLPILLI